MRDRGDTAPQTARNGGDFQRRSHIVLDITDNRTVKVISAHCNQFAADDVIDQQLHQPDQVFHAFRRKIGQIAECLFEFGKFRFASSLFRQIGRQSLRAPELPEHDIPEQFPVGDHRHDRLP